MDWETVLFEKRGQVGLITLNRPERMNALCLQLGRDLTEVVEQCDQDDAVRAVVITGGPKCFSAGGDANEVVELGSVTSSELSRVIPALFCKIDNLSKPVIAAVSGPTLGGGLELAISCDMRVASETALIGLTEVRLGFFSAAGGTQRLPRLIGPAFAKQLIFTGDPVSAAEAYRMGLVNFVEPVESFLDKAIDLASRISQRAPVAVRMAKKSLDTGMQMDLDSALKFEAQCGAYVDGTEDSKEGFRAFAEKRKPVFKGK